MGLAMTCGINPQKMKAISCRMNKLGQHVFHAFAAGSVEELAAALEVITLVSVHHVPPLSPGTTEAAAKQFWAILPKAP